MANNFYCGRESDLASGSLNMADVISAEPGRFGLTIAQCDDYSALAQAFSDVLKATNEPSTRTPVVVAEKKTAKRILKKQSSLLGQIIRSNSTVSDTDLIALGLNLRDRRRRTPVPEHAPRVAVLGVRGRVVSLRISDSQSGAFRAKASGAVAAQIFSFVGEELPQNGREYQYEKYATRAKTEVIFPNEVPSGATVWISARWQNKRGECSIACSPVRITLQGGPILAA